MTISLLSLVIFSLLISSLVSITVGRVGVGVNYGLQGDNLPSADEVVSLMKSRGIRSARLIEPSGHYLKAFNRSWMAVIYVTPSEDLPYLASGLHFASLWVKFNIYDYVAFEYICLGNEVIPGEYGKYLLPAMQNLLEALTAARIYMPVTTAVGTSALGAWDKPSQATFSEAANPIMAPLISFLASKNFPLLVNVFPYFAYAGSSGKIPLDYALFTAPGTVVQDGSLGYTNLFDATVDAFRSAMEKVGGYSVEIVVSESGWPSAGAAEASIEHARIYNNNLVAHINSRVGTPKRPGKAIETFLYALFNENLKPAGADQNFGLYRPDKTEATFSEAANPIMAPLISFLASKNFPLLVNVFPYFAYAGSSGKIPLDYALFTAPGTVVQDGSLGYTNLFDATVDAFHSAMEKVGGYGVEIVVSESGWPSAGAAEASIEHARIYNNNLVAHINSRVGTPKRPGKAIETFLYALFNENLKPAGADQNFGLYRPDKTEATFSEAANPIMAPLISFLASKNFPLLVNVFPYFAYAGSSGKIPLDYALFTAPGTVVQDGSLGYTNLFDATVDAFHSAMEKVGGYGVEIVVSESGWPSAGAAEASIEHARIYNNNLVAHINSRVGTPKRPGKAIETFLYALFNENLKPAGADQNFGLYRPDKTEVYHVNLP